MREIKQPPLQKMLARAIWILKSTDAGTYKFLLLYLSSTLFLWMFLSAEGLERMAEEGRIINPFSSNTKIVAYDFAARWRHGMAGGWPLYMPGFFLTAISAWVYAMDLPWKKILLWGAAVFITSTLTSALLVPYGIGLVIDAFERETGLWHKDSLLGLTVTGTLLGLYTLLTWCTGVIACQRCITRKTLRPLCLPIVLNLVLAKVRPWTVGDLTTLWLERVLRGQGVAILSLILVPLVAIFLLWYQLKRQAYSVNNYKHNG